MTKVSPIKEATDYYINIAPQLGKVNMQAWESLEETLR